MELKMSILPPETIVQYLYLRMPLIPMSEKIDRHITILFT